MPKKVLKRKIMKKRTTPRPDKGQPHVKLEALFTKKQVANLQILFSTAAARCFEFAIEVMTNKDQIEIKQYTKEGQVKKYFTDKISIDTKVRVMEFIGNKVFPDKKVIETNYNANDPTNPAPTVVGFRFTMADTKQNVEETLKKETIAAMRKEKEV